MELHGSRNNAIDGGEDIRKADPSETMNTLVHNIWNPASCLVARCQPRLQILISGTEWERIDLRVESDKVMAAKNEYRQPSCAQETNNNLVGVSGPTLRNGYNGDGNALTPNPEISELGSKELVQNSVLLRARSVEQFAQAGS